MITSRVRLTLVDGIFSRPGYTKQYQAADDAHVLVEIDRVFHTRITGHGPVVVANHGRAERVEREQQRERRVY